MDNRKRTAIQAAAALLQNANLKGFFTGSIYQGAGKTVCVPGLNCYSCPGAVGSCPIGALQNSLSAARFRFPYYIIGLLLFFGALFGRLICAFLCPFGLLQDLLFRIPAAGKRKTWKGDRLLRRLKYAVLLVLVIILPLSVKLTPFFCKYLCPSGTLAGILLACSNTALFRAFGTRFAWKACILGMILLAGVWIARPFCKYLCPLGAIYGQLNRISLFRMHVNEEACVSCGKCAAVCDMGVDPSRMPNHSECIRCGRCTDVCPTKALRFGCSPLKDKNRTA